VVVPPPRAHAVGIVTNYLSRIWPVRCLRT